MIWLPPYHDMGLVGGILVPAFCGIQVFLISPLNFLASPRIWLEAISKYEATHSGGPDFAYSLCVDRPVEPDKLNLKRWTTAFLGAETIRPRTLRVFETTYSPAGFRADSFMPCYGLAESTLMATCRRKESPINLLRVDSDGLRKKVVLPEAPAENGRIVVSCGPVVAGHEIRIVDPETRQALQEQQVGEIWLRGPSVAQGYWGPEYQTRPIFQASIEGEPEERTYLRSGDLGFLRDGELYVTGRLKDLIVIRGKNHDAEDIEQTVKECSEEIREGGCVAFSASPESVDSNDERLVILIALKTRAAADAEFPRKLASGIRKAVTDRHGIHVREVLVVEPGVIARTASRKVSRHTCRKAYIEGSMDIRKRVAFQDRRAGSRELEQAVQSWLVGRIADLTGIPQPSIDVTSKISALGLDSFDAMTIGAQLEELLDEEIDLSLIADFPTIEGLTEHLIEHHYEAFASRADSLHVPKE